MITAHGLTIAAADMAATRAAWPATIAWFRNYLGA